MEFEGDTERDAVAKACLALRQTERDLDYTVVDEGSAGLFGLGSRPVRIRARAPEGKVTEGTEENMVVGTAERTGASGPDVDDEGPGITGPAPEKAARAGEVAEGLASRMGLPCRVSVRDEDARIVVVLEELEGSTAVADMLGHSRPPAVPSFQFLLNKIVNRFPEGRKHILLEVPSVPRRGGAERSPRRPDGEGGNAARVRPPPQPDPELDPSLVALGRDLAARALALGKVITIHPMLPGDRRAIHQTIMAVDGVETVSQGEGLYRRMHIVPGGPKGQEAGARRGGRRRRRRGRGPGGGAPSRDRRE